MPLVNGVSGLLIVGHQSGTADTEHDAQPLHRLQFLMQHEAPEDDTDNRGQAEGDGHYRREVTLLESRVEKRDSQPACKHATPDGDKGDRFNAGQLDLRPEAI